jgi:hypothetical protein
MNRFFCFESAASEIAGRHSPTPICAKIILFHPQFVASINSRAIFDPKKTIEYETKTYLQGTLTARFENTKSVWFIDTEREVG